MWEKIRSVKKLDVWEKVHTSLFPWVALYAQRGQVCSPDSMDSLISLIWPNLAEIWACAFKKCERKVRKLKKVRSVRKSVACEKKRERCEIKWEMWEKVGCVRKSEKNVRKSEMSEKKVRNVRKKLDMWEKVRIVWAKVRNLKKSQKCEKKWGMWEKVI